MHIKKRTKILIALLSLLYSISLVQSTYAKYVSSADADTHFNLSRWSILVNSQDIYNNSNFTSTINPVFENNNYIRNGVLAPNAEGYFDIVIDATNTDVSFSYTIDLEPNSENTVADLEIFKYELNGFTYESTVSNIQNTINYNAANKIVTLRVYVRWNDSEETETMNNAEDTQAVKNGLADYEVHINFTQLV